MDKQYEVRVSAFSNGIRDSLTMTEVHTGITVMGDCQTHRRAAMERQVRAELVRQVDEYYDSRGLERKYLQDEPINIHVEKKEQPVEEPSKS